MSSIVLQVRSLASSGSFQRGVTIGYTYDAFIATDGRSRRHKGESVGQEGPPGPRRGRAATGGGRYVCPEIFGSIFYTSDGRACIA